MHGRIAALMLLGLLAACAQPQPAVPTPPPAPPPAAAPAPGPAAAAAAADRYVTIQRATCETYLGLATDDRASASMFYIGYTARRFGSRTVNVGTIPNIEELADNLCAISPSRTVASAFATAYQEIRKW